MNDLISSESVHGDAWAARIRAEHERLGPACPCGNHRLGPQDEAALKAKIENDKANPTERALYGEVLALRGDIARANWPVDHERGE